MSVHQSSPVIDESQVAGSSLQVTASSPTSLLSKLRASKQSELVWKWKVMVNPPPHTSARKTRQQTCLTAKRVSVAQRAKEFAGV